MALTYEEMMADFHARGWTSQNFAWLNGTSGQQFADVVEFTNGVLQAGHLTAAQKQQLLSQPDLAAAQQMYGQFTPTATPTPPPEATTPPVTAPSQPAGPTPEEQSAQNYIMATLDQFGLGGLADWAWTQWKAGTPVSQIFIDLRSRPEYKARFPAMETLGKSGHALTEAQYIAYERQVSELMQQYGLPPGFYDQPEDFTRFLTNNIAPTEIKARLDAYQTAVWQSPPEVRAALRDLYGLSEGQLMSFFIDETKALPLIERDVAAAQAAGTSVRTGFGMLSQAQAEYLASQGFTQGQLDQGFGNLAGMGQILNGLPGTQQAPISRQTALDAQFGANAEARQLIEAREADLLAPFKGGGGPASTGRGIVGAGVAQ